MPLSGVGVGGRGGGGKQAEVIDAFKFRQYVKQ